MRFVAKISSFVLDAAIGLVGMAFVGLSAQMFDHDIQVARNEKNKEGKKNEDHNA